MADPFDEKEKTQLAGIGLIILRTVIHANLLLASLILSYNSYKEYARGPNNIYHFPVELKVAIKTTFPLAIGMFGLLYFICNALLWRNKKDSSLYIWRYCIIITSQGIILNLVFVQSGIAILIVQNLALIYFALFIMSWHSINRLEVAIEKASAGFLLGFIILLVICAFLLLFKQEKIAKELANIAYLLLVIGVGREAYHIGRLSKHKDNDENR